MRLAFVTDDLGHHAGVHHVQRPDGTIIAAIDSGVLLRATGVTDVLTFAEPKLPDYVAHFYGTGPGAASPGNWPGSRRTGSRSARGPLC